MAHKDRATSSPIVLPLRVIEYRGVNIWPADPNGSGMRFMATVDGMRLRADSLSGIKRMIVEELS